jgi:arsenite-transporting ATPase
MNPDRMVIREAQRTFTYLNLYGYLTDAVVVNRVFPEELSDSYFGAVVGPRMLDRLGEELFAAERPERLMHSELAQRITTDGGRTVLAIPVPFADRSELDLSKVGQELIVRAGREKRTIILPTALARLRPAGARLEAGTLEVSFEDDRPRRAQQPAAAAIGEDEPVRRNVRGAGDRQRA